MENPFEMINTRLEKIERLLEKIYTSNSIKTDSEKSTEIMNVEEVADYISLTPSTIYKYTASREIPHIKKGKRLYFNKKDIDDWLIQSKQLTNEGIERIANNYIINNRKKYLYR